MVIARRISSIKLPFFILSLVLFGQVLSAQGFLKRKGTQIVNDSGVVLLRGVNMGGWLLLEPYILQMPGSVGNHTGIHNAVQNLLQNQTKTDSFFNSLRANYIRKTDIDAIAAQGLNHIRLPFHYNYFYDMATGAFKTQGFQIIDSVLRWCAADRLYLILDLHAAPGAQSTDAPADSDGTARLWSEYATYRPITSGIWKRIADHYKNEPWIGGYDMLNEPVIPNAVDQAKLLPLYKDITDSIRSVDTHHLLFAEGNWYASSFGELLPNGRGTFSRWDDNLAFSFHGYWAPIPFGNIGDLMDISTKLDIPLWLGETGENSNHWIANVTQDVQNRGIGWCVWTYKKLNSTSCMNSVTLPYSYQAVLNYLGGTKPDTNIAFSGLMAMANNALLENCAHRIDYSDALTRTDFFTNTKPYAALTIPGVIPAPYYDMGAHGIAYSGVDYQTLQLNPFTQWNKGGFLRNDGVSIEQPETNVYSVGYISSGEFLEYTFIVKQSGIYEVIGNFGALAGGGTCHVEFDNIAYIDIEASIPGTGGWYNWKPFSLGKYTLRSGVHRMKFVADNAGFNVKDFTFSLLTDVDKVQANEGLKIIPNLVSDQVSIETMDKEIVIVDELGRVMGRYRPENNRVILHIAQWNRGLYVVRSESAVKKFVKY